MDVKCVSRSCRRIGHSTAEETTVKPKPMVEIGGRPILWHIMKHYAHHGFSEFLIALGYKGECIKRYFLDYYALAGSITVDLSQRQGRHAHQGVRGLAASTWSTPAPTRTPAAASNACSAGSTPARSCSPTATACATSTCRSCCASTAPRGASPRSPPCARRPASAGLLFDGDLRQPVHREAAGRRRLDQRRLHRLRAANLRLPRRRRQQPGDRGARAARRRRAAGRLPPRPLLAVHGHAARQAAARSAVGTRTRTLEGLGMNAVLARSTDARHRRHRPGRRLAGVAAARRRRRRRLPGPRLGAAVRAGRAAAGPSDGADRARRRSRPGRCSSACSASTRSTPSFTWRRRRSSASPTAIRSRRSRRTFAAPGRCSRPAAAARAVQADRHRLVATRPTASSDELPYARRRRSTAGIRTTSASRART